MSGFADHVGLVGLGAMQWMAFHDARIMEALDDSLELATLAVP